MKEEVNFTSRARIIRTLGDKLISNEVAAIVELVKNAYDADATKCFIKIDPQSDLIIIEDNGHGMSKADIKFRWLELGTTNKLKNKYSKSSKRKVLGNKGIGRVAASKLGSELDIYSTIVENGLSESIHLSGLDWKLFSDDVETEIGDIKFHLETFINDHNESKTRLEIRSLSNNWAKDNLVILIKELRRLVSPIDDKENTFNVFLDLDSFTIDSYGFCGNELVNGKRDLLDFSNIEKKIENLIEPFPILDSCDYSFEGVFENNSISGTFIINEEGIKHELTANINREVHCGQGSIKLSIFNRDAGSITNTFTKSGIDLFHKKIGLRDARKIIDELSGIAIYRDGFRVRPYGDSDADWLSLDKRRVQNPSLRLEQAQISGLIFIGDEESSGLIERSSREGFEHNESYLSLKQLLLEILKQIEEIRYDYNKKVGKNRNSQHNSIVSAFNDLSEKIEFKKIESFSEYIEDDKREEFQEVIYEHKTTLESLINSIKEHQAMLEMRSTLGFIIAEVLHEARHYTSSAGAELLSLSKRLKNKWEKDISSSVLGELVKKVDKGKDNIKDLETLYKRLDPLVKVRAKKKYDFSIIDAIEKSVLLYESKIEKLGINVKYNTSLNNSVINGIESDLMTAVVNLIDNSIYWLDNRNIKEPMIQIKIEELDEHIYIFVEDNAGGISDRFKSSIFNVGFTSKENGSGLGLSIARESLGRMASYITHENTQNGSIFKIGVKKEV